MHLQSPYTRFACTTSGSAQWIFEHGLALPSGSGLTDDEVDRVIAVVLGAL